MEEELSISAYYRITIRDKNKKIVRQSDWQESKSFVTAFMELLWVQMTATTRTITDTGGVGRSIPADTYNFRANGPATNTSYGIVVGTGTTPVAYDDYALETLIAQGTGSGQMEYGATTINAPTNPSGNIVEMSITRTMTNNSGDSITVTEAGLYANMDSPYYGCLIRDVLSASEDVADGLAITIDYRLRVVA